MLCVVEPLSSGTALIDALQESDIPHVLVMSRSHVSVDIESTYSGKLLIADDWNSVETGYSNLPRDGQGA